LDTASGERLIHLFLGMGWLADGLRLIVTLVKPACRKFETWFGARRFPRSYFVLSLELFCSKDVIQVGRAPGTPKVVL